MGRLHYSNPDSTAIYVVASETMVKIGITRDPQSRLYVHHLDGFRTILRLWAGLASGIPTEIEVNTLDILDGKGIQPVKGWEYFDLMHLETILGIVDRAFKCKYVSRDINNRPIKLNSKSLARWNGNSTYLVKKRKSKT